MNVIEMPWLPRRPWAALRLLQPLLLVIVLVSSLGSCTESAPAPAKAGTPTGTLELNLVGTGSQGTLFRLRDAVVMLQGPTQTLFFNSEDDPDATSFSALLPAGSYSSFLQEGWRLERLDVGKTVEGAALLSPNPDFFEVLPGERTRVALRFQVERELVATDPGSVEIVLEVQEPTKPAALCSVDSDCAAGQVCCIAGFLGTCQALAPGATCPLPDLTVSAEVAQASLLLNQEFFPAESCAIEEGCVAASGIRRLLRFSTMTPNVGDSDLVLGDPSGAPGFEFAPCHDHFHFNGYARYELVDAAGAVVAVGHKQAFCLLDSTPVGLPGAATEPRYHCSFQGLTRGWADIYDASLDCQWVDVTDVPAGDYLLRISINPERVIEESDFDNNTAEVPVTITPLPVIDPLEPCTQPSGSLLRECGWAFAPGFQGASCTPGKLVTVGCGCDAVASCEGDPVLRVCEGADACSAPTALASTDDTCGLCPQVEFQCPPSGVYSALVAPFGDGVAFSCDLGAP